MRFATLVALAVVASTVPSLAALAPYSARRVAAKRDITSTDDSTIVDTSGLICPSLPNVTPRPILFKPLKQRFNELPSTRKRDITADITAALQSLLQESGSVLSDVNAKRQADSIHPVEERAFKLPKVSTSTSSLFNDIGNVISLGVGANAIASAFGGSNSTRRDLDQTLDRVDVAGDSGGEALQFEDRSFKIPSSVSSILGKVAGVVSAGGTAASLLSAFDGSGNSTRRDLGMDSGRIHDEKRAIASDIESILQQIITSFEGASSSTPTSTKRSTGDNDSLGLTSIVTPEQLDELS
ncbi:hypothetical protein EDB19DRAFT_1914037 [Suillus lakei]|nr:hypothetical protein EDB19DRAFT_1914037 [Suillus lakei]